MSRQDEVGAAPDELLDEALIELANGFLHIVRPELSVGGPINEVNTPMLYEAKQKLRVWGLKQQERGASTAAQAINRELGLELTTNGSYYLQRGDQASTEQENL